MTWRRLDLEGREAVTITETSANWIITGLAEVSRSDERSCLAYVVECDRTWETRTCEITGFMGDRAVATSIRRDAGGSWTVDGNEAIAVRGCIDIDLAFSPVTNLLPIRRLALAVGDAARVRAAWLRFPELTLEVLEQTYTRTSTTQYRYESAGGAFSRELTVDGMGLVVDYPGLWASVTPDPRGE